MQIMFAKDFDKQTKMLSNFGVGRKTIIICLWFSNKSGKSKIYLSNVKKIPLVLGNK